MNYNFVTVLYLEVGTVAVSMGGVQGVSVGGGGSWSPPYS